MAVTNNDVDEEKCIVEVGRETDSVSFICVACPGSRTMQSSHIRRHKKALAHINNFKIWVAKQKENQKQTSFINHEQSHLPSDSGSRDNQVPNGLADVDCEPQSPQPQWNLVRERLIDMYTKNHTMLFKSPDASVHSGQDDPIGNNFNRDNEAVSGNDNSDDDTEDAEDDHEPDDSWYPFASLEQMVGFMVLGSSRAILSLLQYERMRSFFGLLSVNLPAYKTIQKVRRRLKKRFHFDVSESLSPLDKPCFGLKIKDILKQEIANPYVTEFLEFMPSLPHEGSKVSCLAQSQKWREGLDPDIRVQMVALEKGHFYLHEPVQLDSQRIVIPFFFYKSGNDVFAKCVFAHLKWENPHIKIQFQHVSSFDSDLFTTINVNSFSKVFDEVEMRDGRLMKDLCGEVMYEKDGGNLTAVPTTNSWRKKANGRIIRHVPLVLYCDDLSGNKSKRWNKHIAFYFTLAGLPPKLSNQEYNCHFVTTSNTAGALELANPVIDELNDLITNGVVAYDHETQSEVLVMTAILCHLGDSPMHAEVTNTMNPTTSLSPCRVCHLKVKTLMEKRSSKYICDFLGIDEEGNKGSLPTRQWAETVRGTKALWELSQLPGNIGQFDTKSSELGVKDALNIVFVKMVQDLQRDSSVTNAQMASFCQELNKQFGERLFNPFLRLKGFDGHRDTPVEVLHVILLGVAKYLLRHHMNSCSAKEKNDIWGRWRSFNPAGLNIPAIQPKTMIQHFLSLNGKEFRIVLQAAPFIFFQSTMSHEERDTWTALSHLAPYIFQTEISDPKTYRKELEILIRIFLRSIVKITAQWCNKPKFHMLIHLCDAIERFGPPCLFATENFESYNGNTRESSLHSNHLSPGSDIANSMNNYRLMRAFGAGSKIFDHQAQTYVQAGLKVQQVFKNNILFQKALGFNSSWNHENSIELGRLQTLQPSNTSDMIPANIRNAFSAKDWHIIESLTLKNKQKVTSEVFVSLKKSNRPEKEIARVNKIWGVGGCSLHQTKVEANICRLGQVNGFYGMREIKETSSVIWLNPSDIEAILNVQHDCHFSKCQVQKIRPIMIERRVSKNMDYAVAHEQTKDFILNSGALYSAELHRTWAKIPFNEVSPQDWKLAVKTGVDNWQTELKKKDEAKEKKRQKEKDKMIEGQTANGGKKRKTQHCAPNMTSVLQQENNDGPLAGPSTW